MPYPPWPSTPAPFTWAKGQPFWGPWARNDVVNALLLLSQPPVFSGSQTGTPVSFTAISGTSITAPGTSYTLNQPIVFSTGTGGFPSGLTAGQTYFVYNPVGPVFGISATAGGSAYTGYGSGSGTVATTQQITQSAWTGINLDTEPGAGDPWNGHQTSSNMPSYFGMFPGIYLADFTFPANWTGGGGAVSAGLITQEGTSPAATIGGQCGPVSNSAGHYASVSVSKLVQFSVTGSYGAPGNNYVSAAAWQDATTSLTPLATPTRFAQMNAEWVCALTGNANLPVPDCDTWPAPPQKLTAAFTDKNFRDTISFLAFRPVFEAYYAAGGFTFPSSASPSSSGNVVPLDTAYIDPRSALHLGGGSYNWKAPVSGTYEVYGQVPVTAGVNNTAVAAGLNLLSANYNYDAGLPYTIWGAPQQANTAGGEVSCAIVRRRLRLNQGDTIGLAVYLNDSTSAAGVVPSGTWQARLITIWRGK